VNLINSFSFLFSDELLYALKAKNRGPVSQQVWHDKDPSLLKGPERRA
jgi:hypothetical protein